MKAVTSQCLYFQFLSGLVDNDKLIKLYRVGIVIGISFFHYEHAEVIAALLYPVASHILLLVEIEFVAYGAYCLSGISHNVRKRPLAMVLADLDRFIAAGAPLVKFVDRTYNLDEQYFLPMMQHLAAADTKATFHFEIKADMLSEKVLDFLATWAIISSH